MPIFKIQLASILFFVGLCSLIIPNDANAQTQPEISIAPKTGNSSVNEGDNAVFTVTSDLTITASTGLNVSITLTDTNSFLATDTPLIQTANIAMSETTGELSVPTMVNSNVNSSGTISAMITTGTGYTVVDPSSSTLEHTAMITVMKVSTSQDSPTISIAVKNNISSIAEGSNAVFVITSSVAVSDPNGLDINIALTDQNGHLPMGTNLTPTVNIATGESTGELSLPTMVNRTIRRGGFIQAMVTTGTGYQVVDPSASTLEHTVSISITAVPIISIRSKDNVTSINEGEAVEFFITTDEEPTAAAGLDVNVKLTVSGNFLAPNTNLIPVVNIGRLRQVGNLMVQTINDKNSNDDGSITVMITAGTGYVLADPSISTRKHTLMIMVNNIIFPIVSISAASLRIIEGNTANFTITASPSLPVGTELTVMVKIEVSNNIQISATPGVGTHPVRVQSGGTPATAPLDIESLADTESGTFGSITATIQMDPDNFNLSAKKQVIVAVVDAVSLVNIVPVGSGSITEGEPAKFKFTIDPAKDEDVQVNFSVQQTGGNFILWRLQNSVTILANEDEFELSVPTYRYNASDGTISLTLQSGTNFRTGFNPTATINVALSGVTVPERISVADAVVTAILANPPGGSLEPQLSNSTNRSQIPLSSARFF